MFHSNRDAIGFAHPQTGLPPFQTAAMACAVELCFELLRVTPALVLEKPRDPRITYEAELIVPQTLEYKQTKDGGYEYSDEEEDDDDEMDCQFVVSWESGKSRAEPAPRKRGRRR